jgi:hypothetical protein
MPTRIELSQERDSLQRQLQQHRKNLFRLQEQEAMFGLSVPLHILNGIDDAEEKIQDIQARLQEVETQLENQPAEQAASNEAAPAVSSVGQKIPGGIPAEQKATQPTVFISYSHKDEQEKEELVSHLGVLRGEGLIDVWVDDKIGAGSDWAANIDQAMSSARVGILLITKNFLNSKFILQTEVPRLLTRRQNEGLVLFPVIARPCAWRKVEWLARMNVRPKNGAPIWREGGHYVDDELATIAEEVADIIESSNQS